MTANWASSLKVISSYKVSFSYTVKLDYMNLRKVTESLLEKELYVLMILLG